MNMFVNKKNIAPNKKKKKGSSGRNTLSSRALSAITGLHSAAADCFCSNCWIGVLDCFDYWTLWRKVKQMQI